jgi:hypothetical protein
MSLKFHAKTDSGGADSGRIIRPILIKHIKLESTSRLPDLELPLKRMLEAGQISHPKALSGGKTSIRVDEFCRRETPLESLQHPWTAVLINTRTHACLPHQMRLTSSSFHVDSLPRDLTRGRPGAPFGEKQLTVEPGKTNDDPVGPMFRPWSPSRYVLAHDGEMSPDALARNGSMSRHPGRPG